MDMWSAWRKAGTEGTSTTGSAYLQGAWFQVRVRGGSAHLQEKAWLQVRRRIGGRSKQLTLSTLRKGMGRVATPSTHCHTAHSCLTHTVAYWPKLYKTMLYTESMCMIVFWRYTMPGLRSV